ncbi:MAG: SAM-dependent methyltransferase, partial [Chitinophagaceae bacterium]|nr:SAM-dependent methyltransferase [Anaerolineae bacterium]
EICAGPVVHRVGRGLGSWLTDESHILGRLLLNYYARRLSQTSDAPGRLYSFVAEKA